MVTTTLRELIEPAVVCHSTDGAQTLFQLLLQQQHQYAIVLNDDDRPTQLLSLSELTQYLFNPQAPPFRLAQAVGDVLANIWRDRPPVPLQQVEADLSLAAFCAHYQQIVPASAAGETGAPVNQWIVMAHGQPLGRLDLAACFHLGIGVAPDPISLPPSPPWPWLEIFDQMPIPLLLCTEQGISLRPNQTWQTAIGDRIYPYPFQPAVHPVPAVASSGPPPATAHGNTTQHFRHETASDRSASPMPILSLPVGSCRQGHERNTCLCAGVAPDGTVQVWQFIRLALPVTVAQLATWHPLPSLAGLTQPNSAEAICIVVAQNATEQQRLSQELAAKTADLMQLTRFKDEFLACISHELKSPLTAVIGLSHLLKNQSLGSLNPRQARYANLIYESGRHLMTIVNDILDLTRLEAGQLDLFPTPVRIESVCQAAITQAYKLESPPEDETAPPRPIDLQINLQADTILADETRLRQMLTQLLSNALKFTPPEAAIGLTVDSWGRWLAFTVWDQGTGIPDSEQHLIFQKFQQIENPMTRQHGGTGLGLVLIQRLARLHGGDITFTSKAGQGSRFTLLLPPAPPSVALNLSVDIAQRVHLHHHNQLILVVEAVPRFVEDAVERVSQLGYQAAIARSGPEAIEKIRRLQPYAILLNPMLPVLSGWDVLTLLKGETETQSIPIIITATLAEQDQAARQEADGFLTLPLQAHELRRCLEHLERSPQPLPTESPLTNLTVLHINTQPLDDRCDLAGPINSVSVPPVADHIEHLLHIQQCRVIEADDFDQAELLARVWRPDVVLLDPDLPHPAQTMAQFQNYPVLTSLPLITLTPAITRVANQIPHLKVFPCFLSSAPPYSTADAVALNQVLQIAAGMARRPHLMILDTTLLQPTTFPTDPAPPPPRPYLATLTHYLQAAGFEWVTARTWHEAELHLQHGGIDLLILALGVAELPDNVVPTLQALLPAPAPPLVILDMEHPTDGDRDRPIDPAQWSALQQLAKAVIPASGSVQSLLDQIQALLR